MIGVPVWVQDVPDHGHFGVLVDLSPPVVSARTGLVLFAEYPPQWVPLEKIRWAEPTVAH